MTLDLSNPAHVDTLRWACTYSGDVASVTALLSAEAKEAFAVLTNPIQAAGLLRRLLERCGVEVEGFVHGWGSKPVQLYDYGNDRLHYIEHNQPRAPDVFRTIWPHQLPARVLALLDAPDRAAALAVLRGER